MALIGYARVSTNGQALEAQIDQLNAAGCVRVFKEKVSGAASERTELRRTFRVLHPGDILVVTRLDRLARSTRDLLNLLAELGRKRVGFRSIADAWADTTTPLGRLMLTVLGGVAEFERELIRARTAEGRARAVAMGVRMGRPAKLNEGQRQEALARKLAGERVRMLAAAFHVSPSTIFRLRAPGS